MTVKPRLSRGYSTPLRRFVWFCHSRGSFVFGVDDTPSGAYNDWLNIMRLCGHQQPTTKDVK